MAFSIARSIGVDYGHRVMTHGSKCKSIHGHRGTIEVTCAGASLHQSGEQSQMIIDFGFLKEVMMEVIDKSIDHGFVACIDDSELLAHFVPKNLNSTEPIGYLKASLKEKGYWLSTEHQAVKLKTLLDTKLYVLPHIPTSERLAEHFFKRLSGPVYTQSNGVGSLLNLRFWETPACYSDYPGFQVNGER
jgi:6-pyruvoyltetrahydropterin/6-carboxytetrahydropterin synthase